MIPPVGSIVPATVPPMASGVVQPTPKPNYTHQTGRACWLFEVPHVGYMAGNQHEITNVRVTNMRHYAGWLFQITNMRQLRMLVTSNNQHAPTCGPFACWLFQITNMRQLRMLDTSNNQHAKGPQVGLRMLVILFQITNLRQHRIFKIQPAAHVD